MKNSSKGNQYIMVLVHINSSAMLVNDEGLYIRRNDKSLPIPDPQAEGMWHTPTASHPPDFKTAIKIKLNHMTYQLFPHMITNTTLPKKEFKLLKPISSQSSVVPTKISHSTYGACCFPKLNTPSIC
jgi:hypothetical protein